MWPISPGFRDSPLNSTWYFVRPSEGSVEFNTIIDGDCAVGGADQAHHAHLRSRRRLPRMAAATDALMCRLGPHDLSATALGRRLPRCYRLADQPACPRVQWLTA